MTTPILALSEIAEGVASQAALHNTALREFEARTVRVLSKSTTAPPGSPAESDSYIIPTGSPVSWAGTANQIASFVGGAWGYYTPIEGVMVWVNDLDAMYVYYAAAWTALSAAIPTQPYDTGGAYTGVPTASVVLIRYSFPRQVIFASGLSPSRGVAAVAATAQTDFDIRKNGASVGTMRFAAAATTASFIMASQTTFAAGDILTVVAPATPDVTLADIGFALAGTR